MKTGTSFTRTIAYVLGATKEQYPQILTYRGIDIDMLDVRGINRGVLSRTGIRNVAKHVGASFSLQASCRPRAKPVRHYMMTFPPDDAPLLHDNQHLLEIVRDYMSANGICNTQYMVVRHNCTDNPHVHIVFNPVDDNLNVISESRQFAKNQRLCRQLTAKYGLHFSNPRKYKAQMSKSMSGPELRKVAVRKIIEEVLEYSDSPRAFQENLLHRHIRLILHLTAERVTKGVSFQYLDDKGKVLFEFKGSALSRTLSYKALHEYFDSKKKMKKNPTGGVTPQKKKQLKR